MYRNVIFYNSFPNQLDQYTNTISVNIPLQFSNFTAYRIEILRVALLPKKDYKSSLYFAKLEVSQYGWDYTDIVAKRSTDEIKKYIQDRVAEYDDLTLLKDKKEKEKFLKKNNAEKMMKELVPVDVYNPNISGLNFYTNYFYLLSDNDNDSIILNTNTHCNIIGITKSDDNNIFYEGNWIKPLKKDVININIVSEDFSKVVISKFYINIKLIYE